MITINTSTDIETCRGVVLVDCTSGNLSLSIVSGALNKEEHIIIKVILGGNIVTITPVEGETIDGASSYVMDTINECVRLVAHSGGWYLI